MKPIVRYKSVLYVPMVGVRALVFPIDHPNWHRVSNKTYVITSPVIAVHKAGFETENSVYVELGA